MSTFLLSSHPVSPFPIHIAESQTEVKAEESNIIIEDPSVSLNPNEHIVEEYSHSRVAEGGKDEKTVQGFDGAVMNITDSHSPERKDGNDFLSSSFEKKAEVFSGPVTVINLNCKYLIELTSKKLFIEFKYPPQPWIQ
ncbi:unnamed protein product [Ilex paraguariensis]|uniref:Uncharacterized protein n=1 Tax=Ilex paraguariensis TaxID=185542 RepID=A0ABC8TPX0_9AQUA